MHNRRFLWLACAAISGCDPNIVIGTRLTEGSAAGSSSQAGTEAVGQGGAGQGGSEDAGSGGVLSAGAAGTSPVNVIWSTSHETGDVSDWDRGGDVEGGRYDENIDVNEVNTALPRTGKYAIQMTIDTTPRRTHIARYYRRAVAGPAYYSGWFYFKDIHEPDYWWAFFIFRGEKTPGDLNTNVNLWDVNIKNDRGKLYVYLYDQLNGKVHESSAPKVMPVGSWVHFEALFDASAPDPYIKLWQNDELVLDVSNLSKSPTSNIYWGVGNGSNGLNPPVSTLFMDDMVIAEGRVGTDGPTR